MKKFILFLLFVIPVCASAQNRGNVWCFGDSAGIDFNNVNNPVPINTSLISRGTCASISDTNGNLLFYSNSRASWPGLYSGFVWNRNHELMLGGDSIAGEAWYQEMVIVPNPADDSLYYLFTIGVSTPTGFLYSIIDMRGDGTMGAVIQKNVPLLNGLMVDCLTAIKHGNGRDWWILVRPSPIGQPTYNNTWHLYLVSTSGISALPDQNIGELNGTNLGKVVFSSTGDKLSFTNLGGLNEIFDFNRCTGELSNPITIEPQLSSGPYPYYWSSEFSGNSQYLYVSSQNQISRLWQFDLLSSNITTSKTLIWQVQNPAYTAGALKRSPDNKIYFSCAWQGGAGNFPYNSNQYYLENMNLGVIHYPDSLGLACDLMPWSFYLGGKRTYWGLPNNPDYDLGPLIGSPCDSLTSISEAPIFSEAELFVYYAPDWQTAFINANKLKGTQYYLEIFDLMGKSIFRESGKISPPYFTKNLSCSGYSKGMYIVNLQTDKERLVKRFVVQ